MVVAFFYTYTRFKRVERQLTLLVRRLAIQNAALPNTVTGSMTTGITSSAEPGDAGSRSPLGRA